MVAYYGANTAVTPSLVNADGRLAVAADGMAFTDQGMVLDHASSSVWGSGDELFPVLALEHDSRWLLYYIPNGTPEQGQLGVAWGSAVDALDDTAAVQASDSPIDAWGMAGSAQLDDHTVALFVSDVQIDTISAYTVQPSSPEQADGPVQTYQFANMSQGTVFLDRGADRWLLYYRNADASAYGVRVAPVQRR